MPGAIEEALRLEGPIAHRVRRATRDCSIAGADVAAGSFVDAVLGAANLDATVFPDPTRFDIHRRIPATSRMGMPRVLGALADHLEARLVFEELLFLAHGGPAVRRSRGPMAVKVPASRPLWLDGGLGSPARSVGLGQRA